MKKIYLIILTIILLSGCEEVIQVDLNSADPQIVIEANVTRESCKVSISKSVDYFDYNNFSYFNEAEVFLSINNSSKIKIAELVPGIEYESIDIGTVPSTKYNLEVNVDGKTYQAESKAPSLIEIDSLSYKLESSPVDKNKKFLELHVHFKDNPEENNYLRFKVSKNDENLNGVFLYDDRLTNGNEIDFFFFNFRDEEFQKGDEIKVELISLDEPVFTYFKTLRKAQANTSSGPFGSQAPANPISNWSNGALGYFSANLSSTASIILE